MKITTTPTEVAEELAEGNNIEQAEFINQFADSLKYNAKTDNIFEKQCCDIVSKLSVEGDAFITELYEFIIIKNK